MRKIMKVIVLTAVLMLLCSASAFANSRDDAIPVNQAKSITLYTNEAENNSAFIKNSLGLKTNEVIKGTGNNAVTTKYYILDNSVISSDRSIVRWKNTGSEYYFYSEEKNGKATISYTLVTDVYKNNRDGESYRASHKLNKKKITITVKSCIDTINVDQNVVDINQETGVFSAEVAAEKNSTIAIGATPNDNASVKKLAYTFGEDNKNAKNKPKFSVNSAGVVKVVNAVVGDEATLTITGRDITTTGYHPCTQNVIIKVVDLAATNVDIKLAGENYIGKKVYLKTNTMSNYHTYKTAFKSFLYNSADQKYVMVDNTNISFTSSNPKVATVDADGVVTGVGNGSALIKAVSISGNKLKTKTKGLVMSYTVNVTTDVDKIGTVGVMNGIAGKSYKLSATVNNGAGNKKFNYEVVPVGTDSAKTAAQNAVENEWIKVASDGTVTFKKNNEMTSKSFSYLGVKVSSKAERDAAPNKIGNLSNDSIVTIQIAEPISSITIDTEKVPTEYWRDNVIGDVETVRQDNGVIDVSDFIKAKSADNEVLNRELFIKSSNYKIARVIYNSDGIPVIDTYQAGNVKFTLMAKDGSGKSATFSLKVKQKATDIDITSPKNVMGNVLYIEKPTNTDKSVQVKATVDKDASDKKFFIKVNTDEKIIEEYGPNSSTITTDAANNIVVSKDAIAGDKVTICIVPMKNSYLCYKLNVQVIVVDSLAKATADDYELTNPVLEEYESDSDEQSIIIEKGKIKEAICILKVLNGKTSSDNTITWTSSNTKVVTVSQRYIYADGCRIAAIKGVGLGTTTITAKHAKSGKSIKYNIWVVENKSAMNNEINSRIVTRVQAEDRSWTGVDVKYISASNCFDCNIVNPNQVVGSIPITGATELVNEIFSESFSESFSTGIIDYSLKGNSYHWSFCKENEMITLVKQVNGEQANSLICADIDEVVCTIYSQSEVKDSCWLDWLRESITIVCNKKCTKPSSGDFNDYYQKFSYIAYFGIEDQTIEKMIDKRNLEIVDQFNEEENLNNAGIEQLVYDTNKDELRVVISDPNVLVQSDELKNVFIGLAKKSFINVKYAGMNSYGTESLNQNYAVDTGVVDEDAINKMYDAYIAKLGEQQIATIGQLQDAGLMIHFTYYFNYYYYELNTTLVFDCAEDGIRRERNANIQRYISMLNTSGEYLKAAAFDEDAQAFTFTINNEKADATLLNFAGTGISGALEQAAEDSRVEKVTITSVTGETNSYTGEALKDEDTYEHAVIAGLDVKDQLFKNLIDKTAEIRVLYRLGNRVFEFVYEINFVYDEQPTGCTPLEDALTEAEESEVPENPEEFEESEEILETQEPETIEEDLQQEVAE